MTYQLSAAGIASVRVQHDESNPTVPDLLTIEENGTTLWGVPLSDVASLTINGTDSSDTLEVADDLTIPIALHGNSGADQLNVTSDSDLTLSDSSLTSSHGMNLTLDGIESALLTGGIHGNAINASAFTLGPVTLIGGDGDDLLTGSPQGDELSGGLGNDT